MHKREDSAAPDTIGTVDFSFYGSVYIDDYATSNYHLCKVSMQPLDLSNTHFNALYQGHGFLNHLQNWKT